MKVLNKVFRVGFIFAMEEEAAPYRELLESRPYSTSLNVCGVGRTNATIATIDMIKSGADAIVNIGCCGSTLTSDKKWYTPDYFYDGDFDLSVFGNFSKDPSKVNELESFAVECRGKVPLYTYSQFVQDALPGRLIDMEAYPIVALCKHYNIPCLVYKVVSDNANSEADKDFDNVASNVMYKTAEEIIKDIDMKVGGMYETSIV